MIYSEPTYYEDSSEALTIYITEAEKKVLFRVVELQIKGEPNINGKLIAKETKYSESYISELLTRLRDKGLIDSINQRVQKIHQPTMVGVIAYVRENGVSPVVRTSDCGRKKNMYRIRFRPHDYRFKVKILSGPSCPKTWKRISMKGRIDCLYFKYNACVQFMESKKNRWAYIFVPSFFTDDLILAEKEAFERASDVLDSLTKEYGYKFGNLELTHSHLAVTGDPFSHHTSEDAGFIKDKDGRFVIDSSKGYKEFEAVSKFSQPDMEKVFNLLLLPIVKGELNPLELLENQRKLNIIVIDLINVINHYMVEGHASSLRDN